MSKKKTITNKDNIESFKLDFEKWSGFSFNSENREDAIKEISDMYDQLSNEIYDYSCKLEKRIKEIFPETDE